MPSVKQTATRRGRLDGPAEAKPVMIPNGTDGTRVPQSIETPRTTPRGPASGYGSIVRGFLDSARKFWAGSHRGRLNMGERMRLLSRQRPDSADQGACADQGGQRIIDDWIEERTGKPMATVTIADIQTMPRQRKLRWGPIRSGWAAG